MHANEPEMAKDWEKKESLKENSAKLVKIAKALFKDLNKKFPKYDTERKNSTRDFNRVVKYLKGKMPRVPNKKVGEIALNYFNYRKSATGHNIIPSIGRNDIKDMTKLLTSLGMKEASTTKSAAPYQTPFAFRKPTFKAINVDDEDDSDELLGGLKDVRKKNSKKDKEQKKMKELKDHEGKMAKSQLERSMKYSKMIYNMIQNVDKDKDGGVQFPAWVQSYLTKSEDYLQSVFNYLDGKDGLEDKFQTEFVNERISVSDERHFGKKGIIIMIDDNGKKVSAIFKDKKNANKFNRNKPADIKKLLQLAKKTKYPKAIDESVNEISGIDLAKKVVKNKQHEKGMDLFTAQYIVQTYDAYKKHPELRKKIEKLSVPKAVKLANLVMKGR